VAHKTLLAIDVFQAAPTLTGPKRVILVNYTECAERIKIGMIDFTIDNMARVVVRADSGD